MNMITSDRFSLIRQKHVNGHYTVSLRGKDLPEFKAVYFGASARDRSWQKYHDLATQHTKRNY